MAKPTAKKTSKGKATKQPARKKTTAPTRTSARPAAKAPAKKSPPRRAAPARPVKASKPAKPAAKIVKSAPQRVNGAAKAAPVSGVGPAPVAVVAAKPGKNGAGLKARDLEFFRDLLVAKRREIVGDMHSMEQEALRSTSGSNLSNLPMHMADMGTDNYEQEFTLGLVEKDRQLLREINLALKKINEGAYGICEGTGKPIARARLEAKPWARYSIEYTIKLEKGLIRG